MDIVSETMALHDRINRVIALLENTKLLLLELLEYVERIEDKVYNPYRGG